MYCIGLTGSVASGKSTVAANFARLGIEVISADHIARALVNRNQPALQQIVHHFGQTVLLPNGELNRRHLRELIVNNAIERRWLEDLLHPLIRRQIEQDIQHCKSPYCMIEIPLLTDTSAYPYLDRVLLVLADPEQQIIRMMARDHCSRDQACALLETTRADNDKRRAIANDMVMNNDTPEALHNKIMALHTQYLSQATGQIP